MSSPRFCEGCSRVVHGKHFPIGVVARCRWCLGLSTPLELNERGEFVVFVAVMAIAIVLGIMAAKQ